MDDKLKILLCEDDENLGMLLREFLQAKGYSADLCPDGEKGYKAFLKGKYDLCVLDVMMPRKDGFTLAKEIRAVNGEVPIIFLTAKQLKDDVLEGFKLGADDYITKPFVIGEVLARVRSVLRRSNITAQAPSRKEAEQKSDVTFNGLRIDCNEKLGYLDGNQLNLTRTEYDILLFFLTHRNRIYSREELIEKIWDRNVVVTIRTIDTNIARLRKKIGEYGNNIVTRLGFGYGFKE